MSDLYSSAGMLKEYTDDYIDKYIFLLQFCSVIIYETILFFFFTCLLLNLFIKVTQCKFRVFKFSLHIYKTRTNRPFMYQS